MELWDELILSEKITDILTLFRKKKEMSDEEILEEFEVFSDCLLEELRDSLMKKHQHNHCYLSLSTIIENLKGFIPNLEERFKSEGIEMESYLEFHIFYIKDIESACYYDGEKFITIFRLK